VRASAGDAQPVPPTALSAPVTAAAGAAEACEDCDYSFLAFFAFLRGPYFFRAARSQLARFVPFFL
jgi:hypothetical protein